MSVTINLTAKEIAAIKQLTQQSGDTEAVSLAVREYLRLARIRELKAVSGKVDFVDRTAELDALELLETSFPE